MSALATTFTTRELFAYGSLRMPLALLELPLFVLLPAFYSTQFGLSLALIGAVLFGARLLDALADPLIGAGLDRARHRLDFRQWVWIGLPVLTIGFALMFHPPESLTPATDHLATWLAATSVLTYVAYSVVSIAYQSWGAGLGTTSAQRARVTTTREAFGLIGVLAAATLLQPQTIDRLILLLVVLAGIAAFVLRWSPNPIAATVLQPDATPSRSRVGAALGMALAASWRALRENRAFRWLLACFVFNGIATAIPATLVLFFVQDVLGASESGAAGFLATYFLAGAIGMPMWLLLARRFGLRNTWLIGMLLAVIGFVFTLTLDRGDHGAFFVVCVVTGLALGSDLAMPPALLAGVIAEQGDTGRHEGAYFGLWNLATKLNLALAAGIALPILGALGYLPGQASSTLPLSLTYAGLPSALKLVAGVILLIAPLADQAPRELTGLDGVAR